VSFPSSTRGFDSLHPLSPARSSRATARRSTAFARSFLAGYSAAQHRKLAKNISSTQTQRAKASRRKSGLWSDEGGPTEPTMHYVYILESVAVPGHFYIGSTDNLRQRLRQHQADVDTHAAKYRPWKLKTYLAFEKKATAVRFESYLKSGSGRSFCKRHFD
jgi:putative endonuclease